MAERRKYATDFRCTYCNDPSHGFYEGPHGGLAVNILCANPVCRHWFNDMGPFGVMDLESIEPELVDTPNAL